MILRQSSDLLEYLGNTGPITLEELATRTGTRIGTVASELRHLIQIGDIEVQGNTAALDNVLADFERADTPGAKDDFGPHGRPDFFRALRAHDAQQARLRLSFRGFRKVRPHLGR